MKNDSGFVQFGAVLLLFFIAALVAGGALFAASARTLWQADTRDFNNKMAADLLLDGIIEKMQGLTAFQEDAEGNELIASLTREYQRYMLEITDISSGYNLNFLSDADMADSNLMRFLFLDNTGAAFTAWRNVNGLSHSKYAWREFVREDAWDSIVAHGWLHKNDTDSFAFRYISASFGITGTEQLFPLANEFPRMNVNMLSPQAVRPLIIRGSFRIERAHERVTVLMTRLESGGPVSHAEISSILRIPVSHPLMSYLGSKTAFWQLCFRMPCSLRVQAIVAAIPKRDGGVQEVEYYRLIERRFL